MYSIRWMRAAIWEIVEDAASGQRRRRLEPGMICDRVDLEKAVDGGGCFLRLLKVARAADIINNGRSETLRDAVSDNRGRA